MSQSRSIGDFFKTSATSSSKNQNQTFPSPADSRSASYPSPHIPPPPLQPQSSAGQGAGIENGALDKDDKGSIPASQNRSFSSSQRIIKNGKVIVTNSDGDDTDSLSSMEDPDDLLRVFKSSPRPAMEEGEEEHTVGPARPLGLFSQSKASKNDSHSSSTAAPSYKFSLETLVTDAVDDNEVEADIAKIKLAFESSENSANGATQKDGVKCQRTGLRQEILASAIGLEENESSFQRLLDAVSRTDTFSHDLSCSFFEEQAHHQTPLPEPFPNDVVSDAPAVKILKDPGSRERIVYSAFLNTSFSKNTLPDKVILWIFNTIPCEPRDHIRYAYCRAFDFAPQEWISSKLRPTHIAKLFQKLGGRAEALDLSQSLKLKATSASLEEYSLRDWRCLVSVLNLLGRLAEKFSNDTREHTLSILLRLTLDDTLMSSCGVCLEIENAIAALCKEATTQFTGACILRVTQNAFETIQEPELRARLLAHINPITPSVSLIRSRLALSFFLEDSSLLDASVAKLFDLNRLSTRLQDRRFNFSRLKAQRGREADYGELAAFTTFLHIGICSGTASLAYSSSPSSSSPLSPNDKTKAKKAEEAQFNAAVDALARRLKAVFSSIEDSGASHLKRTETKESLEALYYRILYTVRTKPQPKKAFFDTGGPEKWDGMDRSEAMMDRFVTSASAKTVHRKDEEEGTGSVKAEEDIPIRKHTAK